MVPIVLTDHQILRHSLQHCKRPHPFKNLDCQILQLMVHGELR